MYLKSLWMMTGSYWILPTLSHLREKKTKGKKKTPIVLEKFGADILRVSIFWPKIVHLLRKYVLSSKHGCQQMQKLCSLSREAGRGWRLSLSTPAAGRELGRAAAPGAREPPSGPAAGCLTENIQTASCLAPLCSLENVGEQELACCGPAGIAKVSGTKKTAALLIPLLLAQTPSAFSVHMYRQSLHTCAPLWETLFLGAVKMNCCLQNTSLLH